MLSWEVLGIVPYFSLDKAQMARYLCKDRGLMPRLTAVRRIVRNGVFWFGTVEFDCLVWRFVWYEAVWFGTVEIEWLCWQLLGELCGMGLSDLEQSNSTASADNCWRIVWYEVCMWFLGPNCDWERNFFLEVGVLIFFRGSFQGLRKNFKNNDYVTAYQSKSKQTITDKTESGYATTIP